MRIPLLKRWHCLAILFAAVFAAYLNSLSGQPVGFDDSINIQDALGRNSGKLPGFSASLRNLQDYPLKSLERIAAARHVRDASFALDAALFGGDLWWGHLANVLLHYLASAFFFLAAARLLGSAPAGLLASLIFALHPVQTESVAYLAGRRDVLLGFFAFASFYLFLLYQEGKRPAALAGAVFLWLLCLGAKQTAVVLPLLWLGCAAVIGRINPLEHLREKIWLYAGLAAVCLFVVSAHVSGEFSVLSRHGLPPETLWYGGSALRQWAAEPAVLLHAAGLLLWPGPLSADYSFRVFEPVFSPRAGLLLAALSGLLAGVAWKLRDSRPVFLFSLLWTALTYLPSVHLLPSLHNGEIFAEHWLYLPAAGFALAAAGAAAALGRRFPRTAAAAAALVLLGYGAGTAVRNRDWKDDLTLWSKTVGAQPRCARAWHNLAMAEVRRGRLDLAEADLKRSVSLDPGQALALMNLGIVYYLQSRLVEADAAAEGEADAGREDSHEAGPE